MYQSEYLEVHYKAYGSLNNFYDRVCFNTVVHQGKDVTSCKDEDDEFYDAKGQERVNRALATLMISWEDMTDDQKVRFINKQIEKYVKSGREGEIAELTDEEIVNDKNRVNINAVAHNTRNYESDNYNDKLITACDNNSTRKGNWCNCNYPYSTKCNLDAYCRESGLNRAGYHKKGIGTYHCS